MKKSNIPYKVFCKDLNEVREKFTGNIKEITGSFNMLLLKDNQFTAVCNDGKFYLITV